MVWKLRTAHGVRFDERPGTTRVSLDAVEWSEHVSGLATRLGAAAGALPVGRLGALEETPDAFVVTGVLAKREGAITLATVAWPKIPFDSWWAARRDAQDTRVAATDCALVFPRFTGPGRKPDSQAAPPVRTPDPRRGHSAVWTGTEMIVWGGGNESEDFNTGGRYVPATDSWFTTSTGANSPTPRTDFTAVWTGAEMIIWGGYGGSGDLNSGGRYNPSTDSWEATSTATGVPDPRDSHTAVWTGTEMIIWGGFNYPKYLNTGALRPVHGFVDADVDGHGCSGPATSTYRGVDGHGHDRLGRLPRSRDGQCLPEHGRSLQPVDGCMECDVGGRQCAARMPTPPSGPAPQ